MRIESVPGQKKDLVSQHQAEKLLLSEGTVPETGDDSAASPGQVGEEKKEGCLREKSEGGEKKSKGGMVKTMLFISCEKGEKEKEKGVEQEKPFFGLCHIPGEGMSLDLQDDIILHLGIEGMGGREVDGFSFTDIIVKERFIVDIKLAWSEIESDPCIEPPLDMSEPL